MRIAVVGLGKIGTALAAQYLSKGHVVVGCDVSCRTVELVNSGQTLTHDEPGVQAIIEHAVATGYFSATTDTTSGVRSCEAIVVAVPLLVDEFKTPDYSAIDSALHDIAAGLQPGTIVCIETTLPIGDTRNRFGPLLERISSLRAGIDFFLVFSPERVKSGQILQNLATYPKLVGGINDASTTAGVSFYREVLDAQVLGLATTELAEFAKLAASFYRDVNIALANELAMCADASGVDVLEGIAMANTDPTSQIHEPGIGVGGHCIPVYPYFFIDRYPSTTALLRSAREVNDGMASYAVGVLESVMGPLIGKRVVVLGLAFRANVKEATFSMAHLIVRELCRRGAIPLIHDPLFTEAEIRAYGYQPLDMDGSRSVDALIVQTYHDQHRSFAFNDLPGCQAVIDGRNVLPPEITANLDCLYVGLGRRVLQSQLPDHEAAAHALVEAS
jgi:nucleotide sugar dehydrogenase